MFNLLGIVIEHPPQIVGQIAHVDGSVAIGKHNIGSVITRNDNKRAAVTGIKYIVIGSSGFSRRMLDVCKLPCFVI